jgi:uncharacterized membrane-anchored protein YhcB (DUF1043 family)
MTEQHIAPQPVPPPPSKPPHTSGPVKPAKSAKKAWFKRTWVVAALTGVVGLGIGAAVEHTDPKTTPEYKAVAADLAKANTDLSTTRSDLDSTRSDLDAANAKVVEVQGDIPQREAAVKKAEQAVTKREQAVSVAEQDVAKREKKVGLVEAEVARNTLAGDGMYKVGSEMKPGTYKTAGATGCYYAVLNSTNTYDIAENNNIDGPGFVTVRDGQYFETDRCADWVLQN